MYYDTDFVTFLINVTVIEENKSVNSFEFLRPIFGEFHRIQVSTVLTHINIPTQQRLCRTVRMAYATGSGSRRYIAFQYKSSSISLFSYLLVREPLSYTVLTKPDHAKGAGIRPCPSRAVAVYSALSERQRICQLSRWLSIIMVAVE
jgi:hypothetical protein